MGGTIFASSMFDASTIGTISTPCVNDRKHEWIIDTSATNHMVSNKEILTNEKDLSIDNCKKVHLSNERTVNVSHVDNCHIVDRRSVKNMLYLPDFRYNLMSVSIITKELNCSVKFFPDFAYSRTSQMKMCWRFVKNLRVCTCYNIKI